MTKDDQVFFATLPLKKYSFPPKMLISRNFLGEKGDCEFLQFLQHSVEKLEIHCHAIFSRQINS